jgi:parvulin-like peptidyl-prolyl isomerase
MSQFSVFVRVVVPGLVLSGSLAGCDRARDLFTTHAETAAMAAGQELPAERLAKIMSAAKSVRQTREAAEFVANVWIDYTLLAQAVARGELPLDSASVAEAVWPEVMEIKGTHWHDTLMARRSALPPTAVDSLYRQSDQRLFQHILFAARSNAADTLRTAKRKQAETTLTRLRKGAGFGQVASQLSEDAGTRSDSGYLPLGPRGRFVAAFDSAAWSLEPGQTSGVVETPFGYHILRRPGLEEVRKRLDDHLVAQVGMRLDSVYMDSLSTANETKLARDATAVMRAAIEDPGEAIKSPKPLVRFTDGALTTRDYIRWVNALPPQFSARLRAADDSSLRQFARVLAQNTLLLRDAEAGGIRLTPEEWTELTQRYRAQLDTLRAVMGLDAPELTDESVPAAQRSALAAVKVEAYFDRLIDKTTQLQPIPSALTTLLRGRFPSRVDAAGVNRSLELAKELTAANDSAARRAPGGAMRPAPGPAPIPALPAPDAVADSVPPQR